VDEPGFSARGGWWIVGQVPVLLLAALAAPATGRFEPGFAWPGMALVALGFLVAIAGVTALGRALTPFPRPLAQASLRETGAYSWVRHPNYSGLGVASLGWALAWQSVPDAIAAIAVFAFFDRKAGFEERLLRERFPGYAEYASRVRKLLPGIY
jgi:protein-S-isoprenylcysteine O-methyltransferase Ste14